MSRIIAVLFVYFAWFVVTVVSCECINDGNPRNKCALKPGHSLMDWIRLGSSGKDLTHVGSMAGKLQVSPKELAKHRSESDAWLAIRGKVFNVTDYLSFHPGGADQIMQGCGRDCTDLFDNIHPWVNYDKILMKCYIGILTTNTTDEVIVSSDASTSLEPPKKTLHDIASALHTLGSGQQKIEDDPWRVSDSHKINFDWIQKADILFLYFYFGAGANPYVEIEQTIGKKITINILSKKILYAYQIDFLHPISWPLKFKVNYETGKLEVVVNKEKKAVWTTFGTVSSTIIDVQNKKLIQDEAVVTLRKRINYNCVLLEITRRNGVISNMPLGKHVRIFNENNDSRSYSPIPCSIKEDLVQEKFIVPKVCLLVKRYPKGYISTYITDKKINDEIVLTEPLGTFDLRTVMSPVHFIMLAAGTGINPLLGIILALFDRRIKPVKSIDLMFFNRNEEDIIFKDELRHFSVKEPRFHVEFILSQGSAYWGGLRGRVNEEMIRNTINRSVPCELERKDIFILACGSTGFGESVEKILENMHFKMSNLYVFPG